MNRTELKLLEENLCGIYRITSPSGKIYIGQSQNIKQRYRSYFTLMKKGKSSIYQSMRKYGIDKHEFEIVKICDVVELSFWEKFYMQEYNSVKEGLNEIDRNYTEIEKHERKTTWTYERKKKHSEFMKKLWKENPDYYRRDDEFRRKARENNIGIVTAKNNNGEFVKVTQEEYDKRDDLVGTTSGVEQPKLKKPVRCITDDIIFDSQKEAADYYGFSRGNLCTVLKTKKGLGKKKFGESKYFEYI